MQELNYKQNVFDDFIAAAEYLIAQKYFFLLPFVGVKWGLLVENYMTPRELMKVALPAVGVMDMLRYHTYFTAGAGWAYDYGTTR
jgi:prolyl oligopeptidase